MRRIILAAVAVGVAAPVAAQTFTIDHVHSYVGFSVRHMTVSHVRGKFTGFDATLEFDAEDPAGSSVEVTVDAASIDTGQEQRDNHLRSEDFLDVANHPRITFDSTSIAATDGGYDVTGDLTIRGVTQEVVMPVEVAGPIIDSSGKQRLGVSGELTIDRTDFGVAWSRALEGGGLVVGDAVKINIEGSFTYDPNPEG